MILPKENILTSLFNCPYLGNKVELTEEREQHIAMRHPDLLPKYHYCIEKTLSEPDQVRISKRFGNALLFSRWFENIHSGKHVVAVVLSEVKPKERHWIVTAYITRKISEEE